MIFPSTWEGRLIGGEGGGGSYIIFDTLVLLFGKMFGAFNPLIKTCGNQIFIRENRATDSKNKICLIICVECNYQSLQLEVIWNTRKSVQ